MQNFLVTYALSTNPNPSPNQAFESRTDINHLEMIVPAIGAGQAKTVVESMFGGPLRCYVKCVYPV